jgi:hypothetical protein
VKVYLAGPMTGLPGYNYPAFRAAAGRWRNAGYRVECPAENFDGDLTRPYHEYIRAALVQVLASDAIALLPGWERSRGARIEVRMGVALALKFFDGELMHQVLPPEIEL